MPRCHALSGAGRLDVVALGATVNALGRPGFWRQCQGQNTMVNDRAENLWWIFHDEFSMML